MPKSNIIPPQNNVCMLITLQYSFAVYDASYIIYTIRAGFPAGGWPVGQQTVEAARKCITYSEKNQNFTGAEEQLPNSNPNYPIGETVRPSPQENVCSTGHVICADLVIRWHHLCNEPQVVTRKQSSSTSEITVIISNDVLRI